VSDSPAVGSRATDGSRKPAWLRVGLPSGKNWRRVASILGRRGLATVCDSARCPNKAECWGAATATFMVLGSVCTRGCRFCAVDRGSVGESLRPEEPAELAAAVAELGLAYAVVTSVDRDDLSDRGAAHFAACARAIKALPRADGAPPIRVELLIPDYREGEIELVLAAGPDVLAHNIETVERLQRLRDPRASYAGSLRTVALAAAGARASGGSPIVKSSIMLGLGEEEGEVLRAMDDLREAGCSSLVLGHYLRPSPAQVEVARYLDPEEFARYAIEARLRGFDSVVSSPLARTSYHARTSFEVRAPAELGE
jgi:lipoic acid synthetase